jgi:hypothetical protein
MQVTSVWSKVLSLLLVLVGVSISIQQQTCDATTGVCAAADQATAQVADTEQSASKLPKGANAEGKPLEVDPTVCADRHDVCLHYASHGECTKNPGWMIVNCASSCKACHLRDPKVRCNRANLNMSTSPAYAPGQMHTMFESITDRFSDRYGINILSTDPWVVTFDNFLSDQEIDSMLSTVNDQWERSTDTGVANAFGEVGRVLSKSRTSSNAW